MSDTESFESIVNAAMEKVHGNYEIAAIEVAGMLGTLLGAHDREIRDTAQREYDRGYIDGTHSMDAEHRAVAMRLRQLPLDGGSHENLSQIARAVYHADWGWTQGACASLRDELVRLMGGVSDDTCDSQCRGACADSDGRDSGEQTEVDDGRAGDSCTRSHPLRGAGRDDVCICRDSGEHSGEQVEVTDERLADDCAADSRGGDGGGGVHLAGVTYDPLLNERRKAIAELRNCNLGYTLERDNVAELFSIFGANLYDTSTTTAEKFEVVRDRLVHLLGADKPSGIDVLRAMDGNGTRPNDDTTSSITDELRKWASDRHCKGMSHTDVLNIGIIADRIDAQFKRVCQQQEAVLQETIDEMTEERDKARREVIELRKNRYELQRECEELQEKMDEYDSTHVELPRDANDEVFRVDGGARVDDLVLTVRQMTLTKNGWKIRAYDEYYEVEREPSFFEVCDAKPDLIEETIEKLTLGEITQSEAIERIKSFHGTARRE